MYGTQRVIRPLVVRAIRPARLVGEDGSCNNEVQILEVINNNNSIYRAPLKDWFVMRFCCLVPTDGDLIFFFLKIGLEFDFYLLCC